MALPLVGFLMIGVIIYLLLKGKVTPIVVLVIVPFVAAVCLGFHPFAVAKYVQGGIGKTMNTAILLFFSVIFFGVMSDLGVFDVIVDRLVKIAGTNVILVSVVASIIAIIAHFDGATATTVLITIPSMWPIFKRLKMRPHVLLCLTAAGMGVMNLVPWGGPTTRVATVLQMDANELWLHLIPIQIVGAILTIGLGFFFGVMEKRRLAAEGAVAAPMTAEEIAEQKETDEKAAALRNPKMLAFNIFLTLAVIAMLVWNKMPAYVIFLMGVCITLWVNYPTLKQQDARIKAHAPAAFIIGATMIAAGAMVGILNETDMLPAMAKVLLDIIPSALGKYIHMIFGLFALPLGMMIGTDAYFYGVFPLVAGVAEQYGVSQLNTGLTMIIGKNVGLMVSPLVPATYLALGLVNVELKDHIKFSFKYLMIVSIIMLFLGVVLGVITL